MAEFIFNDIIRQKGQKDNFEIASAATSDEAVGCDIYYAAKACLDAHGIRYEKRKARQIALEDFFNYDLIIAMEQYNIDNLRREFPEADLGKVKLLLSFTERPGDVSDPWYTRDFEKAYEDISRGCTALFEKLR